LALLLSNRIAHETSNPSAIRGLRSGTRTAMSASGANRMKIPTLRMSAMATSAVTKVSAATARLRAGCVRVSRMLSTYLG
jgi:hypothetical protein